MNYNVSVITITKMSQCRIIYTHLKRRAREEEQFWFIREKIATMLCFIPNWKGLKKIFIWLDEVIDRSELLGMKCMSEFYVRIEFYVILNCQSSLVNNNKCLLSNKNIKTNYCYLTYLKVTGSKYNRFYKWRWGGPGLRPLHSTRVDYTLWILIDHGHAELAKFAVRSLRLESLN